MTAMGAFAGYFLKRASSAGGNIFKQMFNWNFILGAIIYVLSACINIYLLKFVDYSVIYPMGAVTYIWTMLVSYFFLKEKITGRKIAGVVLIIAGAVLISVF